MSSDPRNPQPLLLEVPGTAADHLYREGSAKASFWEVIFGSGLRAKRRTRVSALDDGTRVFDVPLLDLEAELLRLADAWMASREPRSANATGTNATRGVHVKLIGLQPRGQAVATFSLRFEAGGPDTPADLAAAFRDWFDAEGARVARETLIPFGFTPH